MCSVNEQTNEKGDEKMYPNLIKAYGSINEMVIEMTEAGCTPKAKEECITEYIRQENEEKMWEGLISKEAMA